MDYTKPPKIIMMRHFQGLPVSKPFITASENKKNTQMVIDKWDLGPQEPSNDPKANSEYWSGLGTAMKVDEAEARRRRCSNCEYYDNSTEMQVKMERIPLNAFDKNAGFRGYCNKFDFICHDLRSCQAWEPKDD